MIFRLAEQYLIRAEARAHLNKLTEAASDLNTIRTRAFLPNTSAATQSELYLAIAQERKIELFAEWGHRWYDLKRTGKAIEVMTAHGIREKAKRSYLFPTAFQVEPYKLLAPLPETQVVINQLKQNPGY